jgi:CRISPR/Cas system-associated exonuclease Cas4 (RecB family)
MLVDSRTEGLKSGEESRYIKQLEYHFGVPVKRYAVSTDNMCVVELPEVKKTQEDIDKIGKTVLSATALQNYLSCPAKFYYATVKGLQIEEEVSESLDYGMFGTVFNDVMRAIYTSEDAMAVDFEFDHSGRNESMLTDRLRHISQDYIKSWLVREDKIREKVKALIVSQLKSVEVSGRNLVVTDVIVKYVIKTLQRDLELLQTNGLESFEILGREMPVSGEFYGQRLKGFIDRIDSFQTGQARVVDYKTGKVLSDDEDIHDGNAEDIAEKIFAQDVAERPKIALQFYIYDMLLSKCDLVRGRKIYNSVYSTAKLFKEAPMIVPMNEKFYDAVSERLRILLDEMRDPEVPFRRTSDESVCAYCDFKNICGR